MNLEWLNDVYLFLLAPCLMIFAAVLTSHQPNPKQYRIVKETNTLGEERFEVWFNYPALFLVQRTWRLEEKFDTEQLADEYIARRFKVRELVREGQL